MPDIEVTAAAPNSNNNTSGKEGSPGGDGDGDGDGDINEDSNQDTTDNWFSKGKHEYNRLSDPVCSTTSADCTQKKVVSALNASGVHPNQKKEFIPDKPYKADVDIPGPFGKDHISTTALYDSNGNQIGIRNTTLPDHILYPGTVDRSVILQDGSYYIYTHGEGTGYLGGPNIWFDDMVWSPVDNNVIQQFQ